MMTGNSRDTEVLVEAVQDLTRVLLATSASLGSKAQAVRRLAEFSIPPNRIALLLSMSQAHVGSVLSKARKQWRKDSPDENS